MAALRTSEVDLSEQASRQSENLIALQQMSREAEATRVLYEYFLNRLNETSAQQGTQQADSRILSNAVVPIEPSEPRKPPQVIISTSSVPGKGKTTNSIALVHNLLGLGRKVLLIEGDIRRRTLNEYFKDMPEGDCVCAKR